MSFRALLIFLCVDVESLILCDAFSSLRLRSHGFGRGTQRKHSSLGTKLASPECNNVSLSLPLRSRSASRSRLYSTNANANANERRGLASEKSNRDRNRDRNHNHKSGTRGTRTLERANQEYKQKRMQDKLQRQLKKFQSTQSSGSDEIPSQKQFDNLLAICAASDEWETYEMVAQSMSVLMSKSTSMEEAEGEGMEVGGASISCWQHNTYRTILQECFSVGNGVAALRVLDELQSKATIMKPDQEDFKLAILALCRNNKYDHSLWKKALQLIYVSAAAIERGDLEGTIAVEAYNEVLQCMERNGRFEDALNLLELMEEGTYYSPPNLATYHRVLNTLIASSRDSEAADLLLSLPGRGIHPTIYSYEIVMSALLRRKGREDWKKAVELLDSMHKNKIITPTVMFNRVISACGKAKQLRAAENVFRKMRAQKVQPDTVTFNALISACASTGRAKEALKLFGLCKKEAEVDIITYTNTIRACAKAKMSRKAIQLLEDAKNNNAPLDAFIYTAVIDACAKARMWKDALRVLEDMKKNNVLANEYSYSSAMTACGNCGQWERALELMDEMKEKDMKISKIVYNAAISAIAKGARQNVNSSANTDINIDGENLWVRAIHLLNEMKMKRVWPDAYTYSSVISACASGGRHQEALDIIKEMQNGPPRVRPNKIAYTGAIAACARSGEYSYAMQLFVDMKTDRITCDIVVYNALVSAFATSGKSDLAYDLWNDLCGGGNGKFKDNNSRNDVSPDIITLTNVVASLERAGGKENLARMDEVFAGAVSKQIVLSSDSMDTTWEIDLSGMTLPVARASCRFILNRLKNMIRGGTECEDLMLITGTGKFHQRGSNEMNNKKDSGTTTLREYIGEILEQDFVPPLPSSKSGGIVQIKKEALEQWIKSQEP